MRGGAGRSPRNRGGRSRVVSEACSGLLARRLRPAYSGEIRNDWHELVGPWPHQTPDDAASTYEFNKHVIKHRFCPTCGIHPYGEGSDPKGNRIAAVNLRCIEGLDLAALPVQNFDGRSL